MDQVDRKEKLYEYWKKFPVALQIGNIGSEVSQAVHGRDDPNYFKAAYERALELFDLTIRSEKERGHKAGVREVGLAKEAFCDYFDENKYSTDSEKMLQYFNQFALLAREGM